MSALGQTTGTTSFLPDLNELIEEAFERCGAEVRSGYDFRTAVRSLVDVRQVGVNYALYGGCDL